jgi:transposase-like protein
MIVSVCERCYEFNEVLTKGKYVKTEVREGTVYNAYFCNNCGLHYEEESK